MSSNQASLYFHIPFCTRKCDYCHFYVIPDKDPFKVQLMEGLRLEWEMQLQKLQGKEIVSIYFGGGTPALIGAPSITEILSWVRTISCITPQTEITLEANPENITKEMMQAYRDAGINRVSIGIQTLDDNILQLLGRIHDSKGARNAVLLTAGAGIENISIDLMYDLPGQTLGTWQHTLKGVQDLPISHLSLYNLTIEPHTGFHKHREKISGAMPDPDASLAMYEMAIDMLENQGLMQYEISAFARKERYSRHNVGYWTGRAFLGFGPSAFSYWENKRFRNVANLSKYCKALLQGDSPVDFSEELEPAERRRELLAIELRLKAGVDLKIFQEKYGQIEPITQHTLTYLEQQGLLKSKGYSLTLTKRGVLFYDTVATEII